MDAAEYLRRIGCPGPHPPTPETLRKLHIAHLRSVPFENLDIALGRPIQLAPPALYDKIVVRRRGGFCYELNGLFAWLLEEIGFAVRLLSARVVSDGEPGPDFDHMLLLIDGETPRIADVGFGDSFVEPLPLDSRVRRQENVLYRIIERDRTWELQQRDSASDWDPQYRFTLQPRRLTDFLPRCHHQQTSPDSIFTRKSICSKALEGGRVTLSNGRLIVTRDGRRRDRGIDGLEEYLALLESRFEIDLRSETAAAGDRARRLLGPVDPTAIS